jgi:hypothetical protein
MGFSRFELEPSPKSQNQNTGDPVDVSENRTVRGAVPDTGFGVNPATGGMGASLTVT